MGDLTLNKLQGLNTYEIKAFESAFSETSSATPRALESSILDYFASPDKDGIKGALKRFIAYEEAYKNNFAQYVNKLQESDFIGSGGHARVYKIQHQGMNYVAKFYTDNRDFNDELRKYELAQTIKGVPKLVAHSSANKIIVHPYFRGEDLLKRDKPFVLDFNQMQSFIKMFFELYEKNLVSLPLKQENYIFDEETKTIIPIDLYTSYDNKPMFSVDFFASFIPNLLAVNPYKHKVFNISLEAKTEIYKSALNNYMNFLLVIMNEFPQLFKTMQADGFSFQNKYLNLITKNDSHQMKQIKNDSWVSNFLSMLDLLELMDIS